MPSSLDIFEQFDNYSKLEDFTAFFFFLTV